MGKWGDAGQRVETSSWKVNEFWDLKHSMVIIVKNTVSET